MPVSKPQESSVMNAPRSAKSLQSSYQQAFVAKKAETINPKELDACRNKIKYKFYHIETCLLTLVNKINSIFLIT